MSRIKVDIILCISHQIFSPRLRGLSPQISVVWPLQTNGVFAPHHKLCNWRLQLHSLWYGAGANTAFYDHVAPLNVSWVFLKIGQVLFIKPSTALHCGLYLIHLTYGTVETVDVQPFAERLQLSLHNTILLYPLPLCACTDSIAILRSVCTSLDQISTE